MGNISYKPIIEKMTWSYSRIESFEQCPYKFFSRYILGNEEKKMFYSSYGSFMHELLADYYRGNLSEGQLLINYLTQYDEDVTGYRPRVAADNYYKSGAMYLKDFKPVEHDVVSVEEQVFFEIGGKPFTGILDLVCTDGDDFYIVDHKSKALKQRSGRKKPTKNDLEIDKMLRQLYLYSAAVKSKYGKFPKQLCFNCFRVQEFIREDFDEQKYNDAIEWALSMIETIENTEDFDAEYEYFKCWNLCGNNDRCDEFIYWVED